MTSPTPEPGEPTSLVAQACTRIQPPYRRSNADLHSHHGTPRVTPMPRRTCPEGTCEHGQEPGHLWRSTTGLPGSQVPSVVHEVLASPGHPLDHQTRLSMEAHLGHDLGAVRVHTDERSERSARSVNALAYTVGNHIAFAAGEYRAGSGEGRRLLAHELTHVVQQAGTKPSPGSLSVGRSGSSRGTGGRGGGEVARWPSAFFRKGRERWKLVRAAARPRHPGTGCACSSSA